MKIENRYYQTRSLILAAYLQTTKKVAFAGINKTNPKEAIFLFDDPEMCESLVQNYWLDRAVVNPKELNNKLSELKDLIFS
ncbi:MAG: DUF5659 domain-containing protein [Deltaproteobacteria bacterium]|nr:DUF5659 domain-containing protein [Deltaproteobacteria bacterium]